MSSSWSEIRSRASNDPLLDTIAALQAQANANEAVEDIPTSEVISPIRILRSKVEVVDKNMMTGYIRPRSLNTGFSMPKEPDGDHFRLGIKFDSACGILNDYSMMGNEAEIMFGNNDMLPVLLKGTEDDAITSGDMVSVYDGKSQYIRIPKTDAISIKKMVTDGKPGITVIYRHYPLIIQNETKSTRTQRATPFYFIENDQVQYAVKVQIDDVGFIYFFFRHNFIDYYVKSTSPHILPPTISDYYSPDFSQLDYDATDEYYNTTFPTPYIDLAFQFDFNTKAILIHINGVLIPTTVVATATDLVPALPTPIFPPAFADPPPPPPVPEPYFEPFKVVYNQPTVTGSVQVNAVTTTQQIAYYHIPSSPPETDALQKVYVVTPPLYDIYKDWVDTASGAGGETSTGTGGGTGTGTGGGTPGSGSLDQFGVKATYATGTIRTNYTENFRSDGLRFDFNGLGSNTFVSSEIIGYFAHDDPPNDEVSGKMGGGAHSDDSRPKVYDMGVDCNSGETRYRTEDYHPHYSNAVTGGKGVGLKSTYVGYKFIKRNLSNPNHILLEIWQDTGNNEGTTPANAWKRIASWIVTSPYWPIPGSDHQETVRIDQVGTSDLRWKWISLRQILDTDSKSASSTTSPPIAPATTETELGGISSSDNSLLVLKQDGNSNDIGGIVILSTGSGLGQKLNGKIINGAVFDLKAASSPTGKVFCRHWAKSGAVKATIGEIDASTVDDADWDEAYFSNTTNTATVALGDRIGIEYTQGSSSDTINVRRRSNNISDSSVRQSTLKNDDNSGDWSENSDYQVRCNFWSIITTDDGGGGGGGGGGGTTTEEIVNTGYQDKYPYIYPLANTVYPEGKGVRSLIGERFGPGSFAISKIPTLIESIVWRNAAATAGTYKLVLYSYGDGQLKSKSVVKKVFFQDSVATLPTTPPTTNNIVWQDTNNSFVIDDNDYLVLEVEGVLGAARVYTMTNKGNRGTVSGGTTVDTTPVDPTTPILKTVTNPKMIDKRGKNFSGATVHFIFWGSASSWDASTLRANRLEIKAKMTELFSSKYFDHLFQYSFIKRPKLGNFIIIPGLPVDTTISTTQELDAVVSYTINNSGLPMEQPSAENKQLYFVYLLPTVKDPTNTFKAFRTFAPNEPGDFSTRVSGCVYTGLVSNASEIYSLSTDMLVSMITNPFYPSGFEGIVNSSNNENINDICNVPAGTVKPLPGTSLSVRPYWSDQDGACIALNTDPTWVSCKAGAIWDPVKQACVATGGGGGGGTPQIEVLFTTFTEKWDAWIYMDTVGARKTANHILNADSGFGKAVVGRVITETTFWLNQMNTPTGIVYFRHWSESGQLKATIGSIDSPSLLYAVETNNAINAENDWQKVTLINNSNTVPVAVGDRIGVEYASANSDATDTVRVCSNSFAWSDQSSVKGGDVNYPDTNQVWHDWDAQVLKCILKGYIPGTGGGGGGGTTVDNRPLTATSILAPVSNPLMIDRGGPRWSGATVHFIFWGSTWNTLTTPYSRQEIVDQVKIMFASKHFNDLYQYSRIKRPKLGNIVINITKTVTSTVSNNGLNAIIQDSISRGQVPDSAVGDRTKMYFVFLPPNVEITNDSGQTGTTAGRHTFRPTSWNSATQKGYVFGAVEYRATVPNVTGIMASELHEMSTDPVTQSAYRGIMNKNYPTTTVEDSEIGDVCESTGPHPDSNRLRIIPGTSITYASSMWSDQDQTCIVKNAVPPWISCPIGYTWDDITQECRRITISSSPIPAPAGGTAEVTRTILATPPSNFMKKYTDEVLSGATIHFIFHGRDWNTRTSPYSKKDIQDSMNAIFQSKYYDYLIEYGIKRPKAGKYVVNTTYPDYDGYGFEDIQNVIYDSVDRGLVPKQTPDNLQVYLVVAPYNRNFGKELDRYGGYHTPVYKPHESTISTLPSTANTPGVSLVYYPIGWSRSKSYSLNTYPAAVNIVLTHEIVEAITDPYPSYDRLGVNKRYANRAEYEQEVKDFKYGEICDVCLGDKIVLGITVNDYRSNQANGCVAPTKAPTFVSCETGSEWNEATQQCEKKVVVVTDPGGGGGGGTTETVVGGVYSNDFDGQNSKFMYSYAGSDTFDSARDYDTVYTVWMGGSDFDGYIDLNHRRKRIGIKVNQSGSILQDRVLTKVDCIIKRFGNTLGLSPGNMACNVRDALGVLKAQMGFVDVSGTLISTTTDTPISFINQQNTYSMVLGDAISIEYDQGTESNFIMVRISNGNANAGDANKTMLFESSTIPNINKPSTIYNRDLVGTLYSGGKKDLLARPMRGVRVASVSSILYNKVITEVRLKLKSEGVLPVNTLLRVKIIRGRDKVTMVQLGALDINSVSTSNFVEYYFVNPSNTYRMAIGDMVAVEFNYGNSDFQYLEVRTSTGDVFDGGNTIMFEYNGTTFSDVPNKDLSGTMSVGGYTVYPDPAVPTPIPPFHYAHEWFIGAAAPPDSNALVQPSTLSPPTNSHYNNISKEFRIYDFVLTTNQLQYYHENRFTITPLPRGRIEVVGHDMVPFSPP